MMGFSSHFPLTRSEEWAEWAGAGKSNQPQLVDMKATPLCAERGWRREYMGSFFFFFLSYLLTYLLYIHNLFFNHMLTCCHIDGRESKFRFPCVEHAE